MRFILIKAKKTEIIRTIHTVDKLDNRSNKIMFEIDIC